MSATRPGLAAIAAAIALVLFAAVPLAAAQPQQAWAAPGKAAVASVASGKPGQVTVAVKKAKGAKGYQYWASTSKKFDQAAAYGLASAKSAKATATLSGLPEGKRVFVKVRAYAGKEFGKWSAVKAVTVKRSEDKAAKLSAEVSSLKSENASLRSENASLRSENTSLRSENASLRAEIARLKSGEGNTDPYPHREHALRLVTGGQQGTYYGFGYRLAVHASTNAGIPIEILSSDGSKANVESIEDGLAELAFCQSDVLAYAYQGTNYFKSAPFENLAVLAELYDEQVQIVTCNPDIKTVADLRGKRVSIGAPNSGVYYNAIDILGAYGITEKDITPSYLGFGSSADYLKNGWIDAAFIVAGAPTPAIASLAAASGFHLVAIDGQHASSIAASNPHYSMSSVPANTYVGQGEAVPTVSVGAVLVASKKVSENDAYAFVKDIFDSAKDPAIASTHEMYSKLSVAKGASVVGVPYHPGAARFFKEEGYSVQSYSDPLAAA